VLAAVTAASVAAPDANSWSFMVMGDWGGQETAPYTTADEKTTAGGMNSIAANGIAGETATPPKFALALGDNFYSHGIKTDCHDPRFTNTFENVFTGDALKSPFKFHVLAGNHDHIGNVTAQIEYSNLNERWSFPTEYYTFTETGGDGSTVQFVMIDTVIIGGGSEILDEESGEIVRELAGSELPGPANKAKADAQLAWLSDTLAKSTADYLIVSGHYPVYSICEHGPTAALISSVLPMLEKAKVTAYLAGHDHCMEYLNTGTQLDHHGVGSAHSNDPSTQHAKAVPAGSLKWHVAGVGGGFASFEVSKSGLTVRHHAGDGSVVFTAPAHAPRSTLANAAEM
jgi:hypothetical protein